MVLDTIRGRACWRQTRPELGRPHLPARTEVEAELAAIWAELLHLDSVGVEDNYFDLGGTSLLAVDMFAQIDQRLCKKRPLSLLIEAPTIANLLASWEVKAREARSCSCAREERGPRCSWCTTAMAKRCFTGRSPAPRIRPRRLWTPAPLAPDVPMAHTRIEDMAAYHIGKMRSVQPAARISSAGCAPAA